jgi:hypothetical protein
MAQSEQAFLAIAQGKAPQTATVKILEYKEMEPFTAVCALRAKPYPFVRGESDEA